MKFIKNSLIIALCIISTLATANNLQITNIQDLGSNKVSFDIAWENAWRVGTNYHDAVWIFVKYRPTNTTQWLHADITSATPGVFLEAVTQADQKGIFIRLDDDYRGNISAKPVTLELDNIQGVLPDFKVFGVEMVYVPQGSFYVGDGAGGSLARYTMAGDSSQPYQVTSENALSNEVEHIITDNTINNGNAYNTTQIDAAFPKGYNSFYCMKYEITQSQYVDFLNTLTRAQQNANTRTDISGTSITDIFVMNKFTNPSFGNGVRCNSTLPAGGSINLYCDVNNNGTENEANDGQSIACGMQNELFVLAYLDWAALRPMSSFEFEKAARGPVTPNPREYVWGTTQLTPIVFNIGTGNRGAIDENASNVGAEGLANNSGSTFYRVGIQATSTSTRTQAAASYYGIMNLGDNIAELMIAPETYNGGTIFTGSLGDGILSSSGRATNADWKQEPLGTYYAYHTIFYNAKGYLSNIGRRTPDTFVIANLGGRGVR